MKLMLEQWRIVQKDRWIFAFLTWVPILVAVMLWWIFYQGSPRLLPIGIVDLSQSSISREFVRDLEASPSLSVSREYQSVYPASQDLITHDIYAYVVIPADLEKNIIRGQAPKITTFYNAQYILVGRLISSSVMAVQATLNAKIDASKALAAGNQTMASALAQSVPVQTQITPLFNRNNNYAQFLVTAMVPALWQIVMVLMTVMMLSANYRAKGLQNWLGEQPLRNLFYTLFPLMVLFVLQGMAFLVWFYEGIGWPMHGHYGTIIAGQILTMLASVIMGAFFYFLTLDTARALSFAGAFTAPSFAFLGVTFPVGNMNELAQAWRSLIPITHYISVQIEQANYGLSAMVTLVPLWKMVGYILPLMLALWLIQYRKKQENEKGFQRGAL